MTYSHLGPLTSYKCRWVVFKGLGAVNEPTSPACIEVSRIKILNQNDIQSERNQSIANVDVKNNWQTCNAVSCLSTRLIGELIQRLTIMLRLLTNLLISCQKPSLSNNAAIVLVCFKQTCFK